MYQSKLGRQNRDIDVWLRFLKNEEQSAGIVLQHCFCSLAAGINSKANFDSLAQDVALQLVRLAAEHEVYRPVRVDASTDVWQYFLQQLLNLVNALKNISIENVGKDAKWAKELLQIAMEHPDYLRLCNVYQIIKSKWKYLQNLSITYRLLYSMAVMATWDDDVEMRERLSQILQTADA